VKTLDYRQVLGLVGKLQFCCFRWYAWLLAMTHGRGENPWRRTGVNLDALCIVRAHSLNFSVSTFYWEHLGTVLHVNFCLHIVFVAIVAESEVQVMRSRSASTSGTEIWHCFILCESVLVVPIWIGTKYKKCRVSVPNPSSLIDSNPEA